MVLFMLIFPAPEMRTRTTRHKLGGPLHAATGH